MDQQPDQIQTQSTLQHPPFESTRALSAFSKIGACEGFAATSPAESRTPVTAFVMDNFNVAKEEIFASDSPCDAIKVVARTKGVRVYRADHRSHGA